MKEYQTRVTRPIALGLAIQQARLAAGQTQRDLAEATGIAQSAISDIEAGKSTR